MIKVKVTRIYRVNSSKDSNLKAFVDVNINDLVIINSVKVVFSREQGLFVDLPSKKAKDGKYYNTVRLLDKDSRNQFDDAVLQAYNV